MESGARRAAWARRARRILLASVILFFAVPALFCAGSVAFDMTRNNLAVRHVERALWDYPAPSGAEVVGRASEFGLMGNGNHCDVVVTQTLLTTLTQAEVRQHYAPVRTRAGPWRSRENAFLLITEAVGTEADGRQRIQVGLGAHGQDDGGLDVRCH